MPKKETRISSLYSFPVVDEDANYVVTEGFNQQGGPSLPSGNDDQDGKCTTSQQQPISYDRQQMQQNYFSQGMHSYHHTATINPMSNSQGYVPIAPQPMMVADPMAGLAIFPENLGLDVPTNMPGLKPAGDEIHAKNDEGTTQPAMRSRPQEFGRKPRKDFAHRLNELKEFKTKHGHLNIPHKYSENPPLGTWIDTQRRRYRKLMDIRKSIAKKYPNGGGEKELDDRLYITGPHISEDHISQLLEIGFDFEPRLSRKQTWERRIEELDSFRKANGHCNVREDNQDFPGLGKWVSYVRRTYRLAKKKSNKAKGKSPKLSEDRIRQLEDMGFIFELKEELSRKRFSDGILLLKDFHAKEGHCNVPSFYQSNPTFGLCVEDMRTEYRKICKKVKENGGEHSSDTLSKDMFQSLTSMSFLKEENLMNDKIAAKNVDEEGESK